VAQLEPCVVLESTDSKSCARDCSFGDGWSYRIAQKRSSTNSPRDGTGRRHGAVGRRRSRCRHRAVVPDGGCKKSDFRGGQPFLPTTGRSRTSVSDTPVRGGTGRCRPRARSHTRRSAKAGAADGRVLAGAAARSGTWRARVFIPSSRQPPSTTMTSQKTLRTSQARIDPAGSGRFIFTVSCSFGHQPLLSRCSSRAPR